MGTGIHVEISGCVISSASLPPPLELRESPELTAPESPEIPAPESPELPAPESPPPELSAPELTQSEKN